MSKHLTFHYARPDGSYGPWRLHRPEADPRAADGEGALGAYWELDLPDDASEFKFRLEDTDGKTDPSSRKADTWQVVELPDGADVKLLHPKGYAVNSQAQVLVLQGDPDPDRLEERVARLEQEHTDLAGRVDEVTGRVDEVTGRVDEVTGRVDEVEEVAATAIRTATQAQQGATEAKATAGTAQTTVRLLGDRLGFVVLPGSGTPAPGLLDLVGAARDALADLQPAVRTAATDFAGRRGLQPDRLPSDPVTPPPDEATVLRLLSLAAFLDQRRQEYQGLLDNPATAGGLAPETFAVGARLVGAHARREVDVVARDPSAAGLAADDGLRLDLFSAVVREPIAALQALVPAPAGAALARSTP